MKILSDKFGRVHDYLRISLTERCNLRCFYCMPEEGIPLRPVAHFMTKHEVEKLASVFVNLGVRKIRLTGGEPLVRNDGKEIIQRLSRLPVELAITTNGILIDKYLDTFKSCGLSSINISLDSLVREKFNKITRRNYFDKVMHNIQLLLDENFHVKLNAVMMQDVNDNELCNFIEFTRDKKIHYRFIEFMPFNGNQWERGKVVPFEKIMNAIRKQYGSRLIKIEDAIHDTAKNYKIEGYEGTFAVISSVSNPFCDTCNRVRLTADGKMKNCLFSSRETDLLTPLRNGEDIEPLIIGSVLNKKAMRGGMQSAGDFSNPELYGKNRSMVAIGG